MRKSIKRNLAYDDQKDLYYVTMHYGMRPDGSRDRCVRTFRCLDDAASTMCCCTRRWRPPSGRGCCGKT